MDEGLEEVQIFLKKGKKEGRREKKRIALFRVYFWSIVFLVLVNSLYQLNLGSKKEKSRHLLLSHK